MRNSYAGAAMYYEDPPDPFEGIHCPHTPPCDLWLRGEPGCKPPAPHGCLPETEKRALPLCLEVAMASVAWFARSYRPPHCVKELHWPCAFPLPAGYQALLGWNDWVMSGERMRREQEARWPGQRENLRALKAAYQADGKRWLSVFDDPDDREIQDEDYHDIPRPITEDDDHALIWMALRRQVGDGTFWLLGRTYETGHIQGRGPTYTNGPAVTLFQGVATPPLLREAECCREWYDSHVLGRPMPEGRPIEHNVEWAQQFARECRQTHARLVADGRRGYTQKEFWDVLPCRGHNDVDDLTPFKRWRKKAGLPRLWEDMKRWLRENPLPDP